MPDATTERGANRCTAWLSLIQAKVFENGTAEKKKTLGPTTRTHPGLGPGCVVNRVPC